MLVVANVIAIALLAMLMVRILRKYWYPLLPILYICIIKLWDGVSIAYLEHGAYSPELSFQTGPSGATIRYVIAIAVTLGGVWLAFRLLLPSNWLTRQAEARSRAGSPELQCRVLVAIVIILSVLLIVVRPSGELHSKSTFGAEDPSIVRSLIFTYLPFCSLLLGMAAGNTRSARTRNLCFLCVVAVLAILISYGNKFSALIAFLTLFFLPYLAITRVEPRLRPVFGLTGIRQFYLGLITALLCIGIGIAKFISIGNWGALDYLVERIFVLQGGIWWYTDYQGVYGKYQPGLGAFLSFIQSVDFHRNSSLMYLMTQAIGYDLTYKIFFVNMSLYTGAFPSVFYTIGKGFPGVLAMCAVVGFVVGLSGAYLVRKIIRNQFALVLLAYSVFLPFLNVIDSGEFLQLFSVALLLKLAIIVTAELSLAALKYSPVARARVSA